MSYTKSDIDHVLKSIASTGDNLQAFHSEITRAARSNSAPPASGGQFATHLEQQIAAIWAEMLGLKEIDLETDFFELGGDSILAVQVLSKMRSELNITLSFAELLDGRLAVKDLASKVEAQRSI